MNRLSGLISAIDTHGSIALVDVDVSGHRFTATLIGNGDEATGWREGAAVTLLFKETEVSLAKDLSGRISMRNRIPCTVTGLDHGKLLTRVALEFDGHAIESVITTRSARSLELAIGDRVEGLVKANEMTLLPEAGG